MRNTLPQKLSETAQVIFEISMYHTLSILCNSGSSFLSSFVALDRWLQELKSEAMAGPAIRLFLVLVLEHPDCKMRSTQRLVVGTRVDTLSELGRVTRVL